MRDDFRDLGRTKDGSVYLIDSAVSALGGLFSLLSTSTFEDAKHDLEGVTGAELLHSFGAMFLAQLATVQSDSGAFRVQRALGDTAGSATSGWLSAIGNCEDDELVALLDGAHELLAVAGAVLLVYGTSLRHPKRAVREAAERGVEAAETPIVAYGRKPWVEKLTELVTERPELAEAMLIGVADRYGEPEAYLRRALGLPELEPEAPKKERPVSSVFAVLAAISRAGATA